MKTLVNEPRGETGQAIHYSSSINILTYAVFKPSSAMPFCLFVCFCNTGAVYYRKTKITIMSSFINAAVLVL